MMKPDLLFIKPGSQKQLYGDLNAFELTAIEPPLWAALVAGYMRDRGYSVEIIDAEVENLSYSETARKIKEINPHLLVIFVSGTNPSASTMNMTGSRQILIHLHEIAPSIKTLLAGLHPSSLPEQTLKEEIVDFVCKGECFYTLPDLLDAIKAKSETYPIKGLWYKQNNGIISNQDAPLVKDLSRLPMPAWDLLPMGKYRAHNWHCFHDISSRQPYGVIYTSLGCPYNCSFCCINSLFGKHMIRYRDPELVIQEIDFLVNRYKIKNIKILDEMFVLNESHVNRLCDLIIGRGYDLNLWAYARVNTITQTMLRKMKKAGINWVAYGFESGSERVLKSVAKDYRLDRLFPAVNMTYDEGLHIGANFIFGLPEDDQESMNQTLEMAKEINAEWANFYCAMAYPGSQLYEQAVKEKWPLPENWQGYSQYAYDTLPLPTKHLSAGEVLQFRDKAFQDYYGNQKYLNMIKVKFGDDVKDYIINMLHVKIKRKNV
jgi:radical SAM superfamily enzyme YgiQ (UPF0313 family)